MTEIADSTQRGVYHSSISGFYKMAKFNPVKKKFVLSEINEYSAIHTPLKSRIKYTCLDVSQSFIVLGATSGGLYVFRREPCTFLQLLPNKEGPITDVLISPDEKLIAFATERCVACVVERTDGGGARLLNRSVEHANSRITALQWVHTSDQVFIGDNLGRLSVINVSLFMSKNIFQIPAFIFMQLDTSVVQISCHDDMLLVSTTTHSYVCDTTKEQYRQIGTKLRDGEYGACYHGEKIYCARPGSRLWEVDLEGTVQSTHQFKQALAVEPALIVSEAQDGCIHKRRPPSDEWPQQSFNFARLSVIGKFLFTFKQDGVYVFNPETVDVVLWSDRYRDIIDAKCFDDTIYIWTKSQKVHALTLVTLEKCLLRTYFRERYKLCHSLCSHFASYLLDAPDVLTSLNPLVNLSNFLDCDEVVLKILKAIASVAKNKENGLQLDSGIYLIDNHHARQKLLFEGKKVDGKLNNELKNNKIRNPRSHSLPPDAKMRQNIGVGGSVPSISTTSLPEMMKKNSSESVTNEFCSRMNRDLNHPIILAPHLHFLPLSSPDIIHDALIEIGHNMSGKLVNGTKTLKDKWQVLEGKLRFTKVDNTFQKMNVKSNEAIRNNMNKVVNGVTENGERSTNGDVLPNGNIGNGEGEEEEEIVIGRKLISNNNSSFVATEIINLCHKLEGLENGHRIDNHSLDKFFEAVLTTYNRYIEFVSNNSRKNKPDVKYFPFNQFLPEKYVGVVQSVFQNSLRSGEVIKRVASFHNNSCLSALSVQELKHPAIFTEVYPVHVLQADAILSQILVIFSEILDPYSILQDLDGLADFPCRYLSWCAVMDRFQDGALQYFTKESSTSVNVGCRDWPLPLLLNAMFLLLRLDQVDPAVEMGRQGNVTIHSVSHVLLKLSSHLTQSSGMSEEEIERKCSTMFLSYVAKFCDNTEEPLEKVDLNDRGMLTHLEKCLILANKELEYSVCRCGFPRPPSNKLARKGWRKLNGTRYPEIGKALLSKFWEKRDEPGHVKPDLISHTDGIKELCKMSGEQDDENFWSLIGSLDCNASGEGGRQILRPGISESIEHLKRICSVVPPLLLWFLNEKLKDNLRSAALFNIKTVLILQLGALEELDHRNDQTRWAQIVELYGKISRGECCFCGRRQPSSSGDSGKLSEDGSRLAMTLLKSLGSTHTMAILRQYVADLPHFMLNKEFYQACILSSLVDSRVEGCRKQVIDQVTNASSTFPLSSSAGSELVSALAVDTGPDCCWEKHLQSGTNHEWGVCVEAQAACALCSLSMRTPHLLADAHGCLLRAFRCGHTFHLVCLKAARRTLSCPICNS